MLLKLLGYIVTALGLLSALVSTVGGLTSEDNSGKYAAIFLGVVALILLVIGYKWTRPRRSKSWRSDPATDKQREFARDLGIKHPRKITKGELSDLISEVNGE